ncbi:ABC transporter, multidrug efflux family [Desulfocucumis palustris]|uniref:ABC transporter, multidrug efflux family n=1 Tax=Desulfocucumis palustris TaxID=1898651 RepID=A0A2L2XJ71_9FIRM|nr:NHLP bacteriocin export ABC transporter permease/ATPase subunit [Desulfocucumis palustris]GBF35763.1 ABC transporter, multidrug efflux family [Desulfocucumis palustris]
MLENLFIKYGTVIALEGNRPLLITDPNSVWVVLQGKATVFSVRLYDGEKWGARSFLFEVQAGGLLFGATPAGEGPVYSLLASGLPGTRLLQVDLAVFNRLAGQPAGADEIARRLAGWAGDLAGGTEAGPPEIKIIPGPEEVIWVRQAAFGGDFIPLGQFHSLALGAIADRLTRQKEAENIRLGKKEKNNLLFFEKALRGMLSVTDPDCREEVREETGEDPLLAACRLVGRAMKIDIVPSPRAGRGAFEKDPLGAIALASRIRLRRLALKGKWHKQDNGPLLAYLEEDNRPVALLPLSPAQYRMHDPAGKTVVPVDDQTAARIKPFAVAFYRPFPGRELGLRDILIFGLESCWKRDLAMVALMGMLGGLLGMAIPIATGIIFDTVIPGGEKAQLLQVALFLAAGALAGLLFQLTRSLAMLRLEGRMEGTVESALWDRLLSLPAPFFKEYTSGELAMRAMGISQIRELLTGVVITTIISSLFSLLNFGLLFYYNLRLAGVATALIAVALAVTLFLQFRQMGYQRQIVDRNNKITGLILQIVGGVTKLRVSGAEKRAFYLWSGEFTGLRQTTYKSRTLTNHLATFKSFFPLLSSMVIFYAMVKIAGNSMGAGKFVAFNAAMNSFLLSMLALLESLLSINLVIPLYERVKPILQAMPEYDDAGADPGELTGSIEVSHVSFRYKKESPLVLDDVSLQVRPGEYVGIVGSSGSGKSTLFRILLGFEKPGSGQVLYNGRPLDRVDIRSVRRQLGVVLQNGQLMPGDIFTNIVGANIHLTLEDAWEAARMAGLDRDIEDMPMGMHTVISEGAGTFSGGQRQRLLIARAIVNRPRIIYFDEATSALDNRTQAVVSQSLDRLQATRIVIAHRLSTIMNCDRIIVLDKGKVAESGTYQELMDKGGLFADLARRQLA